MVRVSDLDISSVLTPLGGIAALLYSFYYVQQLSLSLGVYYGISGTVKAYNITSSQSLTTALAQTSTIALALHLSYVLVPFALLMFSIGILWLFSKAYSRTMAMLLIFASVVYLIIAVLLQIDFGFSNTKALLPGSYIGAALALAGAAYFLLKLNSKAPSRRPSQQISINPDTPYSNMKILSNRLMKKLSGEIRVLDMHFDVTALDNLIQLIGKEEGRYRSILVLAKADRLNSDFEKPYKDFKSELENKKIGFELRVLNEKDASKQHERMLMDDNVAYKIPPLNIINRKSEHIVSIKHSDALHRFNELWAEATKFENLKGARQPGT